MSSSEDVPFLTSNYRSAQDNKNYRDNDSSNNDDDDDSNSDHNYQKSTDNNSSDFKKRLEDNLSKALKPNEKTPSTSSHELSSEFIATPQKFTYIPNIRLNPEDKDQQNIFVQNYPPLPNCEEETEDEVENNEIATETQEEKFIQIPDLTKPILDKVKVDFRAENFSNFYDGILQNMKKRYGSNYQTQIVNIFADTKKRYKSDPKYVNRLINSDLKLDWYSTHLKSHPSITIFFSYHQINIKFLSFRAHGNTNFGPNFLHKFRVYGIYDDQTVKCLSAFDSTAINDYEVKANYAISSPDPIRGIHIVSDSGKFGLTAIELFGTVIFNQCQTSFSEKFLTNPETYEKVDVPSPKKDARKGRKSFIKKIKTAFKDSGNVRIPQSDDDEIYDEEKPKTVEKKVVEKGPIESYDPFGPDLCDILKRRYDFTVFPKSAYDNFHKGKKSFCVSFDIVTVRLTGIKITTFGDVNGFIFYATKAEAGKPLEWEHIFSSKKEYIYPGSVSYLYPINNPKEYSHFLIRTYGNKFSINDIKFYGKAIKKKVDEFKFTCAKTILSNPPTGVFTDLKKPGIFESMKSIYGAALYGFVTIKNKTSDGSIGRLYQSDFIESKNRNFSCVIFYFHQHSVKLTNIRFSTSNNHSVKDLYIFGGSSVSTILHRYHTVFTNKIYTCQIKNSEPIDFIAVCNFGGIFVIENFEIFGNLVKNECEYKSISELSHDFDYIKRILKLQVMKMISYQKSEFYKELLSGVDKNSPAVFSVQHSKSYKDDILSYGLRTFKDFVTFFNYGKNGYSILKGNPDNKWKTTTNQYENSFKVLFKHHSVRLTKFKLKTTDDKSTAPEYFYLFGYNTKLKRWDVILKRNGLPLNCDSYYSFDINEKCQTIPYRMIQFYTVTGVVSLSMIELFGDLIDDESELPEEEARKPVTEFNYTNKIAFSTCIEKEKEKFNHGFLTEAMKIYGPRLKNFVNMHCHCLENSFFHEIWGSSNSTFISRSSNNVWDHTISFYFPYHEVFISGYHICSGDVDGINNWSIIGLTSCDDSGTIIDTQEFQHLRNEKSYYRYHTNEFENVSFRVIRFVSYDYAFYFNCLDFFGMVRPVPSSKYLTEEDMEYEKAKLPSSVHEKWREKNNLD